MESIPAPSRSPDTAPLAELPAGVALLRAAHDGDADAFCALVQDQEQRLFRQALVCCPDPAAAEDLAQETLVVAWNRIDRFQGQCRLFTWLCGILINLARNAARRRVPIPVSTLPDLAREQAGRALADLRDPAIAPDERLLQLERARLIQRCLERLPDKHREVVQLRFYADDSIEGIAAALGCSVGTVKSRLFHALEKLQAMPDLNRLSPSASLSESGQPSAQTSAQPCSPSSP